MITVLPKSRSRTEIMHYVLSFCVSKIYGKEDAEKQYPKTYGGSVGFVNQGADTPVKVGDLTLLQSCGPNKWELGWLVDTREKHSGYPEYLIESIEDGSLCWWGNVSISYLKRDSVSDTWRWTDRQWEFQKRWFKVCYKEKNAYISRPLYPEFGSGYEVTLGTRTTHGMDDIQPKRTFPDWRKVTKAMMAQCYDDCVAEREKIQAERKAVA